MRSNSVLRGAAIGIGLATATTMGAVAAPVLTTSYASWAAAAGAPQVNTTVTGQYTPNDPLATVATVNLATGTIGLSDPSTIVVRADQGFPFALSNGFTGDLFEPSGTSVTLTLPSAVMALGFYVATYSNNTTPAPPAGGYVITVSLANGASQTFSTRGGSFSTGVTAAQFFGYVGGPVSSLTISDTDPNGLAFGDFFSVSGAAAVPEPGSLTLVLAGGLGMVLRRRRPE